MAILSKIITVVAGLSAVSSAAPTQQSRPSVKSFSVNQKAVARDPSKGFNFAAHYANTLTKYGGKVSPSLAAAASKGSVNTNPEPQDEEYLTEVNVGGTNLNLDIDTGSADL